MRGERSASAFLCCRSASAGNIIERAEVLPTHSHNDLARAFGVFELPDWRNSRAYPVHKYMSADGYQWEFVRCSPEYWAAFQAARRRELFSGNARVQKSRSQTDWRDPYWTADFEELNVKPPLYQVYESNLPYAAAGLPQAIDQGGKLASWNVRRALEAGQTLIVVDPVASLESILQQVKRFHRQELSHRPHLENFSTYLRVLDARVEGGSYSAISKQLKSENTNTASSVDGVRDRLRAAKRWQERYVVKYCNSSDDAVK